MSKQPAKKHPQQKRTHRSGPGQISAVQSAIHFLLDHAAVQNPDLAVEAHKHKTAVELELEAPAGIPAEEPTEV